MNFNDPMPYLFYPGVRDLGPTHIKAILEWQQLVADGDAEGVMKDLESDADAADAQEEQWAREYLQQPMCYDDKDYR